MEELVAAQTINRPEGPAVYSVDVHQDYELLYWCGLFGCRADELRQAVAKVGAIAEAVEQEILYGKTAKRKKAQKE